MSLSHELAGKSKWFTDNKNVFSIVNKGSMKEDLQNIALNVCNFCLISGILLDNRMDTMISKMRRQILLAI